MLFQRWTGCRPGEAVILRPCDVDTKGAVWIYRPPRHKTQHHGRDRLILIGPIAQAALQPFLDRDPAAYCFSPADSVAERQQQKRLARKTKVQPSQRNRKKMSPVRKPGERYSVTSYRKAVTRTCDRYDIPHWHPNQLRHTRATELQASSGIEAAQHILGHADAKVTQIYAERDIKMASQVVSKTG